MTLRTYINRPWCGRAEVAELADAADSKSAAVQQRGGSTPPFGTIEINLVQGRRSAGESLRTIAASLNTSEATLRRRLFKGRTNGSAPSPGNQSNSRDSANDIVTATGGHATARDLLAALDALLDFRRQQISRLEEARRLLAE